MRYLLVVGFACDVYQREPLARIFFGDKLIDEFYIPHQDDKKNLIHPRFNLKHPLEPYADKIFNEYHENSLPPLRFYELDVDDKLQQALISIDVDNDDSNYNNAFITKSTQLQLKVLSLLPADRKIFEWFRTHSIEWFSPKKKHASEYLILRNICWDKKKKKNYFFNLLPFVSWSGKNGQKFKEVDFGNIDLYIGGSGNFYCELIKKYRILLGKIKYPKYAYLYDLSPIPKILYDKYDQHENQRNSD